MISKVANRRSLEVGLLSKIAYTYSYKQTHIDRNTNPTKNTFLDILFETTFSKFTQAICCDSLSEYPNLEMTKK